MPNEGTEQRRLAAIMFTDMVGYSALAKRNEMRARTGRLMRLSVEGWNFRLSHSKK